MSQIEKEKKLVGDMIGIYCRHKHGNRFFMGEDSQGLLCPECEDLLAYARLRLSMCRYGEAKPACEVCTTHCYRPEMRKHIRLVMRYSGPRLLFYRPIDAIAHLKRKMKDRIGL